MGPLRRLPLVFLRDFQGALGIDLAPAFNVGIGRGNTRKVALDERDG
jgi:hypothetical protein